MAKILAVGIATIDIVNLVSAYPEEDDEIRVVSQRISRGGNATNTLVVLSQLAHQCAWTGVLIDESDAKIVTDDLDRYQIDYQSCSMLAEGKLPTSYITLSEQTASRTIIHHRDCPELSFSSFSTIDLTRYDWIHFEGRNIDELEKMLRWMKQHHPTIPCSLEIEKPRPGVEDLFAFADVLLFSKPYARHVGYESPEQFLETMNYDAIMTCSWGEQGAWLKQGKQSIHHPALEVNRLVDTLGAGDTFNAGIISGLVNHYSIEKTLADACHLAGIKCGQLGFDNVVSSS